MDMGGEDASETDVFVILDTVSVHDHDFLHLAGQLAANSVVTLGMLHRKPFH